MVKIPFIKIPSVRVGSIGLTSNIGTGGATPAPPTPITYLTQWKIVGNSEVHGNEIWSCGEYNATDGKYHILVQPLGGSIADIALTEPLRKVGSVADKIDFANGVATLTRNLGAVNLGNYTFNYLKTGATEKYRMQSTAGIADAKVPERLVNANILCALYNGISVGNTYSANVNGVAIHTNGVIVIYDANYNARTDVTAFNQHIQGVELIYELATPTTELVDAPQIQEAESYSCVISQGGKAVSWSSFETD